MDSVAPKQSTNPKRAGCWLTEVGNSELFPAHGLVVMLLQSSHTFLVIFHGQLLTALTPSQQSQQTPTLNQLTHSFVALVFLLDTAVAY